MLREKLRPTVLVAGPLLIAVFVQAQSAPVPELLWPDSYPGTITKVEAATVFAPSTDEDSPALLVLAGSTLVLVRDPMGRPELFEVATGVSGFTVLPPVGGASRVAVSTAQGLHLSQVSSIDGHPKLVLSAALLPDAAWQDLVLLDAAASAEGTWVCGAKGNQIARASLVGTNLENDTGMVSPTGEVLDLAVGDTEAAPGAEVAITTSTQKLYFLTGGSSSPYFTHPHPLPLGDVGRIPGGADTRDSFGFIAKWDYGGGFIGDVMCEVVGGVISSPIYGGPRIANSIAYASAGKDGRADFVMSSFSTSELLVLHGTSQGSSFPFEVRPAPEFSLHPFSSLASSGFTPVAPLVACADFDGDEDGDIALIGDFAGGRGMWFSRGETVSDNRVVLRESDIQVQATFEPSVDVQVTLDVEIPATWSAPGIDRVRVRVWRQNGVGSLVEQTVATPTQRFIVAADQAFVDLTGISTPADADNTILHFEFKLMRTDDATGSLIYAAAPLYAAGCSSTLTLAEFLCAYPDEYLPPEIDCDGDDAPIISVVNRRTIIRPTSVESQPTLP